MDLEELYSKPIDELTLEEIRILFADIKFLNDTVNQYKSLYGALTEDQYDLIVIESTSIIINNDVNNRITIDPIFKNNIVKTLMNFINQKQTDSIQLEKALAQRLINL